MGGALARRLLRAHSLHVYDVSEAATASLSAAGAARCASPAAVADACNVVFTCLPTSDHVRRVLFGADGIGLVPREGLLVVDQTTGDPIATRAMADELRPRGIELIDAPVSGGPHGADAGTIAIMVGASTAQYARLAPILRAVSPNVFHAGGVGTGHVAKLANNMISGAQRLLSLEAVALAVKNGIEPGTAVDIILAGSGRNFFIERFMRSHILTGKLTSGFTLELLHKDISLAVKLGGDSGVPLHFGNLAKEIYQTAKNEFGGNAQVNMVARLIDRLAGTAMVPPEGPIHVPADH
jgi:3-hydroxyisobutyrate dehydrogenase